MTNATERNIQGLETADDPYTDLGLDLCPVCGQEVYITCRTTDGRLIGSCKDAFTYEQWNWDYETAEMDE